MPGFRVIFIGAVILWKKWGLTLGIADYLITGFHGMSWIWNSEGVDLQHLNLGLLLLVVLEWLVCQDALRDWNGLFAKLEVPGLSFLCLADLALLKCKSSGLGFFLLFFQRIFCFVVDGFEMDDGLWGFHENDLVSSSAGFGSVFVGFEFDLGKFVWHWLDLINSVVGSSYTLFLNHSFSCLSGLDLLCMKSCLLKSLLSNDTKLEVIIHLFHFMSLDINDYLAAVSACLSFANFICFFCFESSDS